jgi:tetratricopeptide (TPR) repeat protein
MVVMLLRFMVTVAGLVAAIIAVVHRSSVLLWPVLFIALLPLSSWAWESRHRHQRLPPWLRFVEFFTSSIAVVLCILSGTPAGCSILLTLGVTWYLVEMRDCRYSRSLGMLAVLLVVLLPIQFPAVEVFLQTVIEGIRSSGVRTIIWIGRMAYVEQQQMIMGHASVDLGTAAATWPIFSLLIMFTVLASWNKGRSWLALLIQLCGSCVWLSVGEFVRVLFLGVCGGVFLGNGRVSLVVAASFGIVTALGLTLLTDLFLEFLIAPIRGYGWFNRLVSGPKQSSNADDSSTTERDRRTYDSKSGKRSTGLVRAWWYTRTWWRGLYGVPLFLVVASLITVLLRARTSMLAPEIIAGLSGDLPRKESTGFEDRLRTLVWLQPENLQWKWMLGQHLLERGGAIEGEDLIRAAAPKERVGVPEARLWLATELLRSEEWSPELSKGTEIQLQRALEESPENLLLHFRHGQLFERDGDMGMAENKYRKALALPESGLALAELLRRLQRHESEVQVAAESAVQGLQAALEAGPPLDNPARISLSRALQLAGRGDEAMAVLQAAPSSVSSEPLLAAMNRLNFEEAIRLLQLSPLNRRLAKEKLLQNIAKSPSDRQSLRLLVALRREGEVVPAGCLRPSIEAIRKNARAEQLPPLDLFLLGEMYEAADDVEIGADLLQGAVARYPNLVPMCVRLQRRSGRFQAAETLLSETIQSCRDFLMVSPADQRTLMRLQECLSLSARSREFNQFIINARDALSRSGRLEADAAFLQSVESRAFLAEFDQLSSWSSRVDRAEVFAEFESVVADADPQMRSNLIELLMRCFQDPTAQDEAAQRLVDLTLAEARIAEDAQGIVDEILSRGSTGGTLQALLGTRCLQRGDCARAEALLNAARIHSNDQNAIVLNNLAVAMVRVDIRNAGQALIYIDNALTLQPRYPAFEATKGEILIALKRWPEAFELLEHAIAAGFKDPATLEHASIAAAAVGKAEQAELYREEFRLFTAED